MYNKAKRKLDLVASIIGIVCGAIYLIVALVLWIQLVALLGYGSSYSVVCALYTLIFLEILCCTVGVLLLVSNIKVVKMPVKKDGVWENRFKKDLFACITLGLFTLIGFIFKIIALCLDTEVADSEKTPVNEQPSINDEKKSSDSQKTIEDKIVFLKKLYADGVIDDETLNSKIKSLIENNI